MQNKLPKAIIFDWDNTLIDSWPLIHAAINKTMAHMGKPLMSLEEIKCNIHKSMRESFPQIFGDRWQEAGDVYVDSYKKDHLDNLQFLPDAVSLIEYAQQLRIDLFVISNKMGDTLRKEAKKLKVADKFINIVGAGDAKKDKPSKDVVDFTLKNSGQNNILDPRQDFIWFVGDTIVDVECAINSGCLPVLYGAKPPVDNDEADKNMLYFTNHRQIISFLQNLA
jgi:phosphoglycolate phosphatase